VKNHLLLWLTACAAAGAHAAQPTGDYPARPIRFIVPYAPGGNGDIVSRIVAQRLSLALGQQVVIDNRAGAGGNLGAEIAAHAPPDGHTIVLGTNTHAINMSLYAKPGYDLIRDFAPIGLVSSAPMVLIVHPSLPVKSVKDLIAHAKRMPSKLNYATGGNGSSAHVITELFASLSGVELTHVAYKGAAQATTDLISGQVQVMFNATATALAHMQAGRVRGLAISTAARSPLAPGLPTVAESGLPGFEASIWQGLLAPARTPPAIVGRLHAEVTGVLGRAETKEQLGSQGVDAMPSTPSEFAVYIRAEIAKWSKVVRSSGARVE
jgi:tripartite-type tricarboxylate transporter receptor subunit TctC